MTRVERLTVCLSLLAAPMAAACGPKHISGPVRPGQALIVLLQDSDTRVTGRAGVSNRSGSVNLTAERDATLAASDRRPTVGKLSSADVKNFFGDALSALPPPPRRFTLFFLFESDRLTDESRALVPEILKSVKEHSVPDVVIVGHTDTMGTEKANFDLGLKRALVVKALLVDAGLDAATLDVTSHGELDLLVKTADETPEPRNRRVDIAVR
jgi:outer membrane protein OmpA-like peptidoglycan-associated protein